MKRFIFAIATTLAVAVAAGAQSAPETTIVATVNGEKITLVEFDAAWNALSPEVQANYERSGGRITYLETYIKRKLVVQEAIKNNLSDQPDVAAQLRRAREEVLFDSYVKKQITPKIVSDAEVRDYWEKNQKEFERPERLKARHIIATPSDQQVVNTSGDNAVTDEQALEKIKAIAQQFRIAGAGNQTVTPQQFADFAVKFSEDGSAPFLRLRPQSGDRAWVQYDFAKPSRVSSVEVYWKDDKQVCVLPASWRLLYKDENEWKPVAAADSYGVEKDRFNRVSFKAVRTSGLRLEIQLQGKLYKKGELGPPDGNYLDEDLTWYECGIIEWRVE